ncbi:hypothetical protein M0R19_01645 [Candidatus Pacearchaeota archaeon]|jgi:hypothetical protein|nr:hypothetical protein [Candidatus Pacearchaeota archaeon]
MKNRFATISVVIIILLLAGGIIYFKNFQSAAIKDMPSEEVSKWIGEHSILYVQTGCSHCITQEEMFGINVKFLNIINCLEEENIQKCIDLGIEATPTWIINNKKYEGVQSIEKLKELTGYQD